MGRFYSLETASFKAQDILSLLLADLIGSLGKEIVLLPISSVYLKGKIFRLSLGFQRNFLYRIKSRGSTTKEIFYRAAV